MDVCDGPGRAGTAIGLLITQRSRVQIPPATKGLPTELPVSYRQNCFGDLFLSIARGSDNGPCRRVNWFRRLRWPVAGLSAGAGRALPGWVKMNGGAWGVRWSAVWEVVAQAGPPPPCPPGDASLAAAGRGPPGADLAHVGGRPQQRGEDRLGGDAADAASGGLGQGFVSSIFDQAVEAFDGVPQGGVGLAPGRAAVGQVLAVAGADVRGDGDRGLAADPGRFGRWLEYLGAPVAGCQRGLGRRAGQPWVLARGRAGQALVAVGVWAVLVLELVGAAGGDLLVVQVAGDGVVAQAGGRR